MEQTSREKWYAINGLGIEISQNLKVQKLFTKNPIPVRRGSVSLYNPKTECSDTYSARRLLEHATGEKKYEKVSRGSIVRVSEVWHDIIRYMLSTLTPEIIAGMSRGEQLTLLGILLSPKELKDLKRQAGALLIESIRGKETNQHSKTFSQST